MVTSDVDLSWVGRRRRGFKLFRREMDNTSVFFLTITFVFFFLFLVVPLSLVSILAFVKDGALSLGHFEEILFLDASKSFLDLDILSWDFSGIIHLPTEEDPVFRLSGISSSIFVSTLFVGIMTTVFSVLLGVTFAFIMARYEFIGKEIVRVLVVIPLVVPPFVGALGLQLVFGKKNSLFNNLFFETWGILPFPIVIEGLFAIILVQSLHFYTLVYLNSLSAFMNIDPTLEEQGENLGASGFRLFRKITWPLALPGITGGAILPFILSIEDIGTPLIFGSDPQSRQMMSFEIFRRVTNEDIGPLDGVTQVYSVFMLALAIIGFLIIRKYVSLRDYATYSKGGTFNARTRKIGSRGTLIFYLMFIPSMFLAFAPHLGTFLYSISIGSSWIITRDVLPTTIDPRIFGLMALPIFVYLMLKVLFSIWPKNDINLIRSVAFQVVMLLGLGAIVQFMPNLLNFVLNIPSIGLRISLLELVYLSIIILGLIILVVLISRDKSSKELKNSIYSYLVSGLFITILILVFIDSYYFLLFGQELISTIGFNPITLQDEELFHRPAYSPIILILLIVYWVLIAYLMVRIISNRYEDDESKINPLAQDSDEESGSRFTSTQKTNIILALTFIIPIIVFLGTGVLWGSYDLVFTDPEITRAAIVTLVLALIAVTIIVILGISASYILARRNFKGKTFVDIMVTMPIAVPGVVLAMGYMVMAFLIEDLMGYQTGGILKGYGPYFILIIAFSVRRFPFTVRAAFAGLQQTHETFEEAAHDLGASQPRTLIRIVIPLIGANVFAGALVSFVYSLAEASTTLVWIQNLEQATIPYLIYNYWALTVNLRFQHAAAALGILLILAQVIAITVSNLMLKRRGSALTGI